MPTIYLDHAATTPVHPKVAASYMKLQETVFGNPSSIHQFGRDARKWLDIARKKLAHSIHAEPSEIIITSGGTEADNLAVMSTAVAQKEKGNHIITTMIEHHAVLNPCKQLELLGYDVTYLEVDDNGLITPEQVKSALTDKTILVSIMYGNNEVLDNAMPGADFDDISAVKIDIRAQTRACVENVRDILFAAGGGLEQLVEVTTYYVDVSDFAGSTKSMVVLFASGGQPAPRLRYVNCPIRTCSSG